jgi:hypothetical protein
MVTRPALLLILSGTVTSALSLLYVSILYKTFANGSFYPDNWVAGLILSAGVVRLMVVVSWRRLREERLSALFNLFSVEVFSLPLIFALYLMTHSSGYLQMTEEVFLAWPAMLVLIFPVVSIYKLALWARSGSSFLTVSASTMAHLALLSLVSMATLIVPRGAGISYLSRELISVVAGRGAAPLYVLLPAYTIAAFLTFIFLLLYPAASALGAQPVTLRRLLVTPLTGVAGAALWVFATSPFTKDPLIVFTLPTLFTMGALWWFSREV